MMLSPQASCIQIQETAQSPEENHETSKSAISLFNSAEPWHQIKYVGSIDSLLTEGDWHLGLEKKRSAFHLLKDICPPLSGSCSGISFSRQRALPAPDISHVPAVPGALERAAPLHSQRKAAVAELRAQKQPQKNNGPFSLCGNLENV